MRRFLIILLVLLSGCAAYGGYGLQPGVATLNEVLSTMGQPAMRWDDPDGRVQLAYPRGPMGTETYMVFVAPDGRLQRIEQVLTTAHFARIENGKSTKEDVLRLLGPSYPGWTMYFDRRDELAWEWRFNDGGQAYRLDVLIDATTGIVRSTFKRMEQLERDIFPAL